jgi:hypothetical protein
MPSLPQPTIPMAHLGKPDHPSAKFGFSGKSGTPYEQGVTVFARKTLLDCALRAHC